MVKKPDPGEADRPGGETIHPIQQDLVEEEEGEKSPGKQTGSIDG